MVVVARVSLCGQESVLPSPFHPPWVRSHVNWKSGPGRKEHHHTLAVPAQKGVDFASVPGGDGIKEDRPQLVVRKRVAAEVKPPQVVLLVPNELLVYYSAARANQPLVPERVWCPFASSAASDSYSARSSWLTRGRSLNRPRVIWMSGVPAVTLQSLTHADDLELARNVPVRVVPRSNQPAPFPQRYYRLLIFGPKRSDVHSSHAVSAHAVLAWSSRSCLS